MAKTGYGYFIACAHGLVLTNDRFTAIQSLHHPLEHPAGGDVFRFDRHQIQLAEPAAHAIEQAIRLTHAGSVDGVADRAGIGEKG